jgi:cell division protein FtsB
VAAHPGHSRSRARAAIRQLDHDGVAVTFTAVAAAADVSRSLLYRDPDLHAEISRLRTHQPRGPIRRPAAERTSDDSLQQRLATLLDDNHALRDENRKLRDQIAVLLGQQRAATKPSRPQPQTLG